MNFDIEIIYPLNSGKSFNGFLALVVIWEGCPFFPL